MLSPTILPQIKALILKQRSCNNRCMPFGFICLYIVSPRSILCDRAMNVWLKFQLKWQLRDSPWPCPPWWVYIPDQPQTQSAMSQEARIYGPEPRERNMIGNSCHHFLYLKCWIFLFVFATLYFTWTLS